MKRLCVPYSLWERHLRCTGQYSERRQALTAKGAVGLSPPWYLSCWLIFREIISQLQERSHFNAESAQDLWVSQLQLRKNYGRYPMSEHKHSCGANSFMWIPSRLTLIAYPETALGVEISIYCLTVKSVRSCSNPFYGKQTHGHTSRKTKIISWAWDCVPLLYAF